MDGTRAASRSVIPLLCAVLLMGLAGVAVAVHDTDVIHACTNRGSGVVRVVDDAADCDDRREEVLDWNVQGPVGPAGTDGPQGPEGPPGPPGAPGAAGFQVSTIDGAGDVGEDPSVAFGTDGLGLISYYGATAVMRGTPGMGCTTCRAAPVSAWRNGRQ